MARATRFRFVPLVHRLASKGNEMAAITEAALGGEWFYLVEEEPLDRTATNFYVLRVGEVRIGQAPELMGTYSFEGDEVVITLRRGAPFETTITLSSRDAMFNSATDVLSASASQTMPDGGEPLDMYGWFIRRFADFSSSDDVR